MMMALKRKTRTQTKASASTPASAPPPDLKPPTATLSDQYIRTDLELADILDMIVRSKRGVYKDYQALVKRLVEAEETKVPVPVAIPKPVICPHCILQDQILRGKAAFVEFLGLGTLEELRVLERNLGVPHAIIGNRWWGTTHSIMKWLTGMVEQRLKMQYYGERNAAVEAARAARVANTKTRKRRRLTRAVRAAEKRLVELEREEAVKRQREIQVEVWEGEANESEYWPLDEVWEGEMQVEAGDGWLEDGLQRLEQEIVTKGELTRQGKEG